MAVLQSKHTLSVIVVQWKL